MRLDIQAEDIRGAPTQSDLAAVTSSDNSVATVTMSRVYTITHLSGASVRAVVHTISFVNPGTAVVRVTLQGATDSVVVHVQPLPPISTALVVDSFSVAEYAETCGATCLYMVYAPLLKLRESTGHSFTDVVAVQITVPGMTLGWCTAEGNTRMPMEG